MDLLGFTVAGHPLDLHPDVKWDTTCPIIDVEKHVGEVVTIAGMIIADRVFQQSGGEQMKFLTIADYSGVMETELFSQFKPRVIRSCA